MICHGFDIKPGIVQGLVQGVVGTALFAQPLIFAEEGVAVHVNSVPATFEVRVIPVGRLSHCAFDAGEFERFGVGNTVTV